MDSSNKAAALMRSSWNQRAEKDAFHYVETNHSEGDIDGFFVLGEERAALLIDPVLPERRGLALDIGCGLGRMSRALSKRFEKVIGVDVSDQMVERARQLNSGVSNAQFMVGDGMNYPVTAGLVDFAFSYEVFQHMPSHDVIARNVAAVGTALRPGGTALIHVKTGFGKETTGLRQWTHQVPTWVFAPVKKMLGKDPLKTDETYRGALPLSEAEIERMFRAAGMRIVELRPDPTHEVGTRVFVNAAKNA